MWYIGLEMQTKATKKTNVQNKDTKKCYFSTKFVGHLNILLKIKCTKLDSFRFDISIVQCLGVYFFIRQSVISFPVAVQ